MCPTIRVTRACAQAALHLRECNWCPPDLATFLCDINHGLVACKTGALLAAEITLAEKAIADAVGRPAWHEAAS